MQVTHNGIKVTRMAWIIGMPFIEPGEAVLALVGALVACNTAAGVRVKTDNCLPMYF
jgi:hypothetical protein